MRSDIWTDYIFSPLVGTVVATIQGRWKEGEGEVEGLGIGRGDDICSSTNNL